VLGVSQPENIECKLRERVEQGLVRVWLYFYVLANAEKRTGGGGWLERMVLRPFSRSW
jgi:hypothetical protein